MTEQPKTNKATRLKLHHKAMQVIPEWMDEWAIVPPVPRNTQGVAALNNLNTRLKAALNDDEQIRADLLATCEACERFMETGEDGFTVEMLRDAIAKAKGDQP